MDHLAQVGDADRLVLNGWCYLAARELFAKMVEAGELKAALGLTGGGGLAGGLILDRLLDRPQPPPTVDTDTNNTLRFID